MGITKGERRKSLICKTIGLIILIPVFVFLISGYSNEGGITGSTKNQVSAYDVTVKQTTVHHIVDGVTTTDYTSKNETITISSANYSDSDGNAGTVNSDMNKILLESFEKLLAEVKRLDNNGALGTFPIRGIASNDERLELENIKFINGFVKKDGNDYYLENVTDGTYCANGKEGSIVIEIGNGNKFIHVAGTDLVDGENNKYVIKSINLINNVYQPKEPFKESIGYEEYYHDIAYMGFNGIRFLFNARWFEKVDKPYTYIEENFQWLDEQIEYAEQNGLKIMLDMHLSPYDISNPAENGYQQSSVWEKDSVGDRFTALWKKIAERYADNPTILGYSLINEPQTDLPVNINVNDINYEYYAKRYISRINKTIDAIREVDKSHIITLSSALTLKRPEAFGIPWDLGVPFETYLSDHISDNNMMIDFHPYFPLEYALPNYGLSDRYPESFITYPSDVHVKVSGNKYYVQGAAGDRYDVSDKGNWQVLSTTPRNPWADNGQFFNFEIKIGDIGDGTVWLDDLRLIEHAPDGTKRILYSNDYDSVASYGFYSVNGPKGVYDYTQGYSRPGALKLTQMKANSIISPAYASMSYLFKPGYKYEITIAVKAEGSNLPVNAIYPSFNFYNADKVEKYDKDLIDNYYSALKSDSVQNNRAYYMGEIGTMYQTGELGYGAEEWIKDTIDSLLEYDLSFAYFAYTHMGVYEHSKDGSGAIGTRYDSIYNGLINALGGPNSSYEERSYPKTKPDLLVADGNLSPTGALNGAGQFWYYDKTITMADPNIKYQKFGEEWQLYESLPFHVLTPNNDAFLAQLKIVGVPNGTDPVYIDDIEIIEYDQWGEETGRKYEYDMSKISNLKVRESRPVDVGLVTNEGYNDNTSLRIAGATYELTVVDLYLEGINTFYTTHFGYVYKIRANIKKTGDQQTDFEPRLTFFKIAKPELISYQN